jgi:hypothetical protein
MLANLGQANAIDLVARGGVQTGQDSAAAIDQRNRALADEDAFNIRFIGDEKQQQLSFRKQNLLSAVGSEQLAAIGARLGTEFRQQNLETQVGAAGQKAQDIGTDAMFSIGNKLLSSAGSFNFGSNAPPKQTADQIMGLT